MDVFDLLEFNGYRRLKDEIGKFVIDIVWIML